jgi:hypothetical protein
MITIHSYLHRDPLSNLIRRWMYNQVEAQDPYAVLRLVRFNHAFVSLYLPEVARLIFGTWQDTPVFARRATVKGDLKDAIVADCPYRTPRIEEMVALYRADPGQFYRETPFQGDLYYIAGPRGPLYIGSTRIKRVRRLAEKCARRIIDRIYTDIKNRAESLARERAMRLGLPMEQLITPRQEMEAEFLKAENRLLDDLKNGRPIFNDTELSIQDVAGIKVVVEDADRDRFLDIAGHLPGCELTEVEDHRGNYNAVNIRVRYTPDRQALLSGRTDAALAGLEPLFGMDRRAIRNQFEEFVYSGEAAVNLEVIVSNYQEMLESEIGCCMHEDRILRQRFNQQYNYQLARNIEFLLAYLFAFSASGRRRLEKLPLRVWDRYLPDYFDEVLKSLCFSPGPG